MAEDSTKDKRPEWLGTAAIGSRLWSICLSGERWKFWAVLSALAALGVSGYTGDWRYLVLPFYGAAMLFIFLVVFVLTSMIADHLADWLIRKILREPNPSNAGHQALYLLLAFLSIIPALYFIGIGGFPGD